MHSEAQSYYTQDYIKVFIVLTVVGYWLHLKLSLVNAGIMVLVEPDCFSSSLPCC